MKSNRLINPSTATCVVSRFPVAKLISILLECGARESTHDIDRMALYLDIRSLTSACRRHLTVDVHHWRMNELYTETCSLNEIGIDSIPISMSSLRALREWAKYSSVRCAQNHSDFTNIFKTSPQPQQTPQTGKTNRTAMGISIGTEILVRFASLEYDTRSPTIIRSLRNPHDRRAIAESNNVISDGGGNTVCLIMLEEMNAMGSGYGTRYFLFNPMARGDALDNIWEITTYGIIQTLFANDGPYGSAFLDLGTGPTMLRHLPEATPELIKALDNADFYPALMDVIDQDTIMLRRLNTICDKPERHHIKCNAIKAAFAAAQHLTIGDPMMPRDVVDYILNYRFDQPKSL